MIFFTADIHSDMKRFNNRLDAMARLDHRPGNGDVIVVLGDLFGLTKKQAPTLAVKHAQDRAFLRWLSQQDFQIVALYGNHDTQRLIKYLGGTNDTLYGDKVDRLSKNVVYMRSAHRYILTDGTTSVSAVAIGGGFSHLARLEGTSPAAEWAMRTTCKALIHKEQPPVDFILSHDGPLSCIGPYVKICYGKTPSNEILEDVKNNMEYRYWLFGHHHADIGRGCEKALFYRVCAIREGELICGR